MDLEVYWTGADKILLQPRATLPGGVYDRGPETKSDRAPQPKAPKVVPDTPKGRRQRPMFGGAARIGITCEVCGKSATLRRPVVLRRLHDGLPLVCGCVCGRQAKRRRWAA